MEFVILALGLALVFGGMILLGVMSLPVAMIVIGVVLVLVAIGRG